MTKETYKKFFNADNVETSHLSWSELRRKRKRLQDAQMFVNRLLVARVPLHDIHAITDPDTHEVKVILNTPYPNRQQKSFRRFGKSDYKRALDWYVANKVYK